MEQFYQKTKSECRLLTLLFILGNKYKKDTQFDNNSDNNSEKNSESTEKNTEECK